MNKTITIQDDRIEILKDGYDIIEKFIHGENVPEILIQALTFARDELDMDNMNAINVLGELIKTLELALSEGVV